MAETFTIKLSPDEIVILADMLGRWGNKPLSDLKLENDGQRHALLGLSQELVPHSWIYQDRPFEEWVAEAEKRLVEQHGQIDRQD